MLLWATQSVAQPGRAKVTVERSSPYEAARTFTLASESANYQPEVLVQTIDFRNVKSDKKRAELTRNFQMVIHGRGLVVDLDRIPRDPDYYDSTLNGHIYLPFPNTEPRIRLEKKGPEWRISSETVDHIDEMFAELYPYGIDRIIDFMPHDWPKILGLETWKLLGLLILLSTGVIIGWVVVRPVLLLLNVVVRRSRVLEAPQEITRRVRKPLMYTIAFMIVDLGLPMLQFTAGVSRPIIFVVKGLIMVSALFTFLRLSDLLWKRLRLRAEATESPLDDALVPLAEKTFKFLATLVGLALLLQSWDFEITALVAGVSIGGLAFAFAAQDTIKNVFGSAMIFVDKPFQIGDFIRAGDIEGQIESIGFRSTRVRTPSNSLVTVPNGSLADMNVDNLGLRSYRRYRTMLGLQYDTPPEKMEAFIAGVRRIVNDHPLVLKDESMTHIYFNEFQDSSLAILVWLYFDVRAWPEELKAREELNFAFLRLAAELGVSYAFPSRTVYLEGGSDLLSKERN
jgi:MscS family membrane protein